MQHWACCRTPPTVPAAGWPACCRIAVRPAATWRTPACMYTLCWRRLCMPTCCSTSSPDMTVMMPRPPARRLNPQDLSSPSARLPVRPPAPLPMCCCRSDRLPKPPAPSSMPRAAGRASPVSPRPWARAARAGRCCAYWPTSLAWTVSSRPARNRSAMPCAHNAAVSALTTARRPVRLPGCRSGRPVAHQPGNGRDRRCP